MRRREVGEHRRTEQLLDGVVAEERGEEHRDRREMRDTRCHASGHALADQPGHEAHRQGGREPEDHQREEDTDREHLGGVLEGRVHARARAAVLGGQAVHHPGTVRRGEGAHREAVQQEQPREQGVGEVHRQQLEQRKARRSPEHPTGREGPGAEVIGEEPRDRAGDQETEGEREHVDPRPERRLREAVAVLGQPDALQPDDEHEHEPAAPHRREEARQHARRVRPDPEQRQPEHGMVRAQLDHCEDHQEEEAAPEEAEHPRARPAHGAPAVGLDAVGDADHDGGEPDREADVARPVDGGTAPDPALAQHEVGPGGADHAEGDGHEEDVAPVDGPEDPAEHQADEGAADAGHVVDPERHPALVRGERVGEDRRGVRDEEGRTDALDDPEADEVERARPPRHPVHREDERGDGVDREAEVVHLHAAVHVSEAPERDDEDARDDEEREDHPEQVEAVPRLEGIELDPPEDVRERDQHDRRVDRRHHHAEGGVRERDPLVPVVHLVATSPTAPVPHRSPFRSRASRSSVVPSARSRGRGGAARRQV